MLHIPRGRAVDPASAGADVAKHSGPTFSLRSVRKGYVRGRLNQSDRQALYQGAILRSVYCKAGDEFVKISSNAADMQKGKYLGLHTAG